MLKYESEEDTSEEATRLIEEAIISIQREENRGVKSGGEMMPQLCMGLLPHAGNRQLKDNILLALDLGYRHFDGADAYGGPKYIQAIQEALTQSSVPREEIWITWKTDNVTLNHIQGTLDELGCKYFDLLLYHHDYQCSLDDSQFEHFKEAQHKGLIRHYGVSNCEDLVKLQQYKTRYNIYANQVQARPPKGTIKNREKTPSTWVEQMNKMGIIVMFFASISSAMNANDMGLILPYLFGPTEDNAIYLYYLQKFIQNTQNVIIVGTHSGRSLQPNLINFTRIVENEKVLLDPNAMEEVESNLQKTTLAFQ